MLEKSKKESTILELYVYAKNVRAIDLYKKHGFTIEQQRENNDTHEIEYTMIWKQ